MDLDNNTDIDATDDSFAVQIAKSLAVSAATTAGTLIGFAVIGIAYDKFDKRRTARAAKKNQTETTEK
jgi:hypothetical protein